MRKISFVIPCFRSEKTIEGVVSDIFMLMKEHENDTFEIILVNDNSPDETFSVIERLAITHEQVVGIDMTKNFGQHAALMAGMRYSTGDVVICLDDDGQTPPSEAYKLIAGLEKWDVAYGDYGEKHHSGFRNWGSAVNGRMLEMMLNKPHDLYASSYFAAKRFVVDKMCEYTGNYPYLMGLVLRSTDKVGNIRIEHKDRETGNSGYSIKKLLALWINGFTAFSVKPLRMAAIMGCFFAVAGIIYAIWAIYNKIVNPLAPLGWTTTVIMLLLIGGLILFVLGLIGEYIGRIYMCINNSPQYVIRDVVGREHDDSQEQF